MGHATLLNDATLIVLRLGDVDPGVIMLEAGRPDHGVDLRDNSVGEGHRLAACADRARPDGDALPRELLGSPTDYLIAAGQPFPDAGVPRHPGKTEQCPPPPQVAAQDPLGKRGIQRAYRELNAPFDGELQRDLTPRVCGSNHKHSPRRETVRVSVIDALD